MTEYETKSLKLLGEISQRLGMLVEAAGLTLPEEPQRAAMKISTDAIEQAKRRPVIRPSVSLGGWMGR